MPDNFLAYAFYRLMWTGLDVLFPPLCGGCEKTGSRWCSECQQRVQILDGTLCEVCGLPLISAGICASCSLDRPHFYALRSWVIFDDPIRKALHKLKYRRNIGLGDALAAHMSNFVKDLDWMVDTVIPIPLGHQRQRERGYNQVGMIAKPLSLALNVKFAPKTLIRRKETRSQVGLTRQERRENVHNAFQVCKDVSGMNILLLDDVSTTGSTLSSGAKELYSSGAKKVFAFTVARALPHHGLKHV